MRDTRLFRNPRNGLKAASAVFALVAALALVPFAGARAEPYLAVRTGLKCVSCHLDPDGGGLRTVVGDAFARAEIARRTIDTGAAGIWTGEITNRLRAGGDVRADLGYTDISGMPGKSDFALESANLYGAFTAIPNLLSVYVDEQVAPGSATPREVVGLLRPGNGRYTVKVGKFFLPFGLRLQDDSAYIRSVTGINYETPDTGAEFGLELPKWSAQLAVTNGTAGGGEVDTGKQLSLSAVYVKSRWRLGASYNVNNAALGDREMGGLFAGLRTGPIAWLAEVDHITDETPQGDQDRSVSLLEGNWHLAAGQNLKVTYEFYDPPGKDDGRERYSVVWELGPFQLLQTRLGVRAYNGVPGDAVNNRREVFAELHAYF